MPSVGMEQILKQRKDSDLRTVLVLLHCRWNNMYNLHTENVGSHMLFFQKKKKQVL